MYKLLLLTLLTSLITFDAVAYVMEDPNFQDRYDAQAVTEIQRDQDITTAVRNLFLADNTLAPYVPNLSITTEKGVVTIRGLVNSRNARRALEFKANNAGGVRKVINKIEVSGK